MSSPPIQSSDSWLYLIGKQKSFPGLLFLNSEPVRNAGVQRRPCRQKVACSFKVSARSHTLTSLGSHWALQGDCGLVLGKYKPKCAPLQWAWDFHHRNPPEELELNVSAGARFEKAKTFCNWESWTVGGEGRWHGRKRGRKRKKKKKTCFWLFPFLWLSGVSVDICGWLGTFTGGIWPKGPETATSPPWRTAARKNGA